MFSIGPSRGLDHSATGNDTFLAALDFDPWPQGPQGSVRIDQQKWDGQDLSRNKHDISRFHVFFYVLDTFWLFNIAMENGP